MPNDDIANRPLFKFAGRDLQKASILLHTIKADPERLDLVLELQRHLVRCIVRTELRIRRLKCKRKRHSAASMMRASKTEAKARKARINALRGREEELSHLLFLWRCFGDGIAFVYQSKYSLKHLYYDGEYKVKESAGFMTEHGHLKRGFSREYRILLYGIKNNIPVVLSDVTNIVRHGDVCALGGADPLPIEVKTSNNRNARTGRQDEQRRQLAEFYVNDGAPQFRGLQNVRREELTTEELDYQLLANECVATALEKGWCALSPEPGITYVACTTFDPVKFDQVKAGGAPLFVSLTAQPGHLPSYPFSLSFTPANCLAFMQQRFAAFVLIDMAQVKAAFARRGVYATMLMDGTWSIQITKTPENLMLGVQRISELMFLRIATEFLSIEWFAEEFSKVLDYEARPITEEVANLLPGIIYDIPPSWKDVTDCYLQSAPRR